MTTLIKDFLDNDECLEFSFISEDNFLITYKYSIFHSGNNDYYNLKIKFKDRDRNFYNLFFKENILFFIKDLENFEEIVLLIINSFENDNMSVCLNTTIVSFENFVYFVKNFKKKSILQLLEINNHINDKNLMNLWPKLIKMIFIEQPIDPKTTFKEYIENNCKTKIVSEDLKKIQKEALIESSLKRLRIIFENFNKVDIEKILDFRLIDFCNLISFEESERSNFREQNFSLFVKLFSYLEEININYNKNLFTSNENLDQFFIELETAKQNLGINAITEILKFNYFPNNINEKFLQHNNTFFLIQTSNYKTSFKIFIDNIISIRNNSSYDFLNSINTIIPLILLSSHLSLDSLKEINKKLENNLKHIKYVDFIKALFYYSGEKNFKISIKIASKLYSEDL